MNEAAKSLICIICPLGCPISAFEKGEDFFIEGYQCLKGRDYAYNELTNPVRMLTTTIPLEGSTQGSTSRRLAVRTSDPIPKHLIFSVMDVIRNLKVKVPVKRGQVLVSNILNTGIDVIASGEYD